MLAALLIMFKFFKLILSNISCTQRMGFFFHFKEMFLLSQIDSMSECRQSFLMHNFLHKIYSRQSNLLTHRMKYYVSNKTREI